MRLRELRREHLSVLNEWRNDREVVDHLGAYFAFVGPEVDNAWFDSYLSSRDRNVRLVLLGDSDELVGCVYLLGISWVHRSAEFAIMIGRKDYWNRGLGSRATRAMLDHAFCDLQLNRVWLHVNHDNNRARRVYERVGFRHEGTLRSAVFKNGHYVDVDVMGILASEHAEHAMNGALTTGNSPMTGEQR
jgi:RimJ/RimL family protein N-acetyltransferase